MTWRLLRGWRAADTQLLPMLREVFAYTEREPGRATGWLLLQDRPPVTGWPGPFADLGPWLLADLQRDLGTRFTAVAFQAYLDGTGCGWHHDRDWGAQAVLSLGVTRSRPAVHAPRVPGLLGALRPARRSARRAVLAGFPRTT